MLPNRYTFFNNLLNQVAKKSVEKLSFTAIEKRSVASLALIYALRMYGLFLLLPVLAVYADQLEHATPMLIGLAFGVYGLTQAILQIPFGLMSDRYGRKRIIVIGLLIFALGCIVAALSTSIYGVIIGRALQGSGAIAAAVIALTADLTRENQRSKAMAFIGMSIGLAFMLAMLTAPSMAAQLGLQGLFWLIAVLALLAIAIVVFIVPNTLKRSSLDARAVPADIPKLLLNGQLLRLDVGIFILHMVLTAIFLVVPLSLVNIFELTTAEHWKVYLPALVLSIPAMLPLIIIGSKKAKTFQMFAIAVGILIAAQILFISIANTSLLALSICVFVFFWGFNALEAMLPSLITRVAPAQAKGTAIGIYNSFQFSGVFVGGVVAGYLYQQHDAVSVYIFCGVSLILWLAIIISAPKVALFDSRIIDLSIPIDSAVNEQGAEVLVKLQKALIGLKGVNDVTLIMDEKLAYLKVDKQTLDIERLNAIESGILEH